MLGCVGMPRVPSKATPRRATKALSVSRGTQVPCPTAEPASQKAHRRGSTVSRAAHPCRAGAQALRAAPPSAELLGWLTQRGGAYTVGEGLAEGTMLGRASNRGKEQHASVIIVEYFSLAQQQSPWLPEPFHGHATHATNTPAL